MPRLPYREGDWLWIPLGDQVHSGVARIARVGPRGRVLVLYGFGPARVQSPEPMQLGELEASSAALVRMAGDLGILKGEWKILSAHGRFDRARWPMPVFGRVEEEAPYGTLVDYVEGAPNTAPIEARISHRQARQLPPDGVYGYKLFEREFGRALGIALAPPTEPPATHSCDHYVYFASERVARSAAEQMTRAVPGATSEIRASNDKWLIVLRHEFANVSIGLAEVEKRLNRIAVQRHGDYDGWERSV